MKQASIGSTHNFQPCQIVCLEHENGRLYAEVVQVVTSRQVCWVRPLMLALLPVEASLGTDNLPIPQESAIYDLRMGSDLLWPISLFRPALDTEVIPLLTMLDTSDSQTAQAQLNWFVRQVWQANQSDFQSKI